MTIYRLPPHDLKSVRISADDSCHDGTHKFDVPAERITATVRCDCGWLRGTAIPNNDGGWDFEVPDLREGNQE